MGRLRSPTTRDFEVSGRWRLRGVKFSLEQIYSKNNFCTEDFYSSNLLDKLVLFYFALSSVLKKYTESFYNPRGELVARSISIVLHVGDPDVL